MLLLDCESVAYKNRKGGAQLEPMTQTPYIPGTFVQGVRLQTHDQALCAGNEVKADGEGDPRRGPSPDRGQGHCQDQA